MLKSRLILQFNKILFSSGKTTNLGIVRMQNFQKSLQTRKTIIN